MNCLLKTLQFLVLQMQVQALADREKLSYDAAKVLYYCTFIDDIILMHINASHLSKHLALNCRLNSVQLFL
jgi:hypothetical protein